MYERSLSRKLPGSIVSCVTPPNLAPGPGARPPKAGGSEHCVHSVVWRDTEELVGSHGPTPLLTASKAEARQSSRQGKKEAPRIIVAPGARAESRGGGPPARHTADSSEHFRQQTAEDKEAQEVQIILAIAEERLDEASSLLSSVRRGRGEVEEGKPALAPHIESNIGVLEETRERIGDAIEIYRAVQERQTSKTLPWPPPPGPDMAVEQRLRDGLREAVITRTVDRGRRAGEGDGRRGGQLWEVRQPGEQTQTGQELASNRYLPLGKL